MADFSTFHHYKPAKFTPKNVFCCYLQKNIYA